MNEDQKKKIKEFSIKKYALNKDKLGSLIFDEAYKYFEEIQKLFIELIDLDYEGKLTPNEVQNISNRGTEFIDNHLIKLESYDINQDNAKNLHDNITNQIRDFYNSFSKEHRSALTYLRQEAGLENQSAKDLQKAQKEIVASKKEYERLINDLTEKTKELDAREIEVKSKHGKVAATLLAKRFENQCEEHDKSAKKWLDVRNIFFVWIVVILVFNFILYFSIFFANKLNWIELQTDGIFTIEYGIVKLALLSVLSYGLAFCSKNFRIESNLKSINTHRKNVAQTLDDFLATNSEEETRNEMIKHGVEAMFKHLPLGYISNEDSRDSGPMNEIIYKVTDSIKK